MTAPTYPPLTAVADYPLHGWDYGRAYACAGGDGVYDWRCAACVDKAQEQVLVGNDRTVQWKQDAASPERPVTLGWLVARSRFWGVKA